MCVRCCGTTRRCCQCIQVRVLPHKAAIRGALSRARGTGLLSRKLETRPTLGPSILESLSAMKKVGRIETEEQPRCSGTVLMQVNRTRTRKKIRKNREFFQDNRE